MLAGELPTRPGALDRFAHARPLAVRAASGFTLLEIVVVLILLGIASALVAPALLPPDRRAPPTLQEVVAHVQDMAVRRGETLLLDVSATGRWEVSGSASSGQGVLEGGDLSEGRPPTAFALRVAPFGSCGSTLDRDTGTRPPSFDPLTCRLVTP